MYEIFWHLIVLWALFKSFFIAVNHFSIPFKISFHLYYGKIIKNADETVDGPYHIDSSINTKSTIEGSEHSNIFQISKK